MPQVLNNVAALGASRQLGLTQQGLTRTIERLTTGKRINRASDDAAGMTSGTQADQNARYAKGQVQTQRNSFFDAQASDGYLEEATNQALRLSELEGSSNSTSAEYTSVLGVYSTAAGLAGVTGGTDASTALAAINSKRATLAGTMATAQSTANTQGIKAEGEQAKSDNIMGADIGSEMVNLTKYQILMQAGTSALSNANQSSQTILGLFR